MCTVLDLIDCKTRFLTGLNFIFLCVFCGLLCYCVDDVYDDSFPAQLRTSIENNQRDMTKF